MNTEEYEDKNKETYLTPKHADKSTCKNGQWLIGKKTLLPGTMENVKMSKTGKHGHAKFTFLLRYPCTGGTSQEMFAGHTNVQQPIMRKSEWVVTAYDPFDGIFDENVDDLPDSKLDATVTCSDENFEERTCYMHIRHGKNKAHNVKEGETGQDFYNMWVNECGRGTTKEMVVTVQEGPTGKPNNSMLRTVTAFSCRDFGDEN